MQQLSTNAIAKCYYHMHISILLIDVGLVILAWMIQLIVYPGFAYYEPADIKHWHRSYVTRISMLVVPLMIGQVVLHGLLLSWHQDAVSVGTAALIVVAWISTFLQAAPLHDQMAKADDTKAIAEKLVKANMIRTVAWTVVFLMTLSQY